MSCYCGKLGFYRHHRKFATACKDWYRITMELHGPFQKNSLYLLLPYDNEKETATLCQISNLETYTFNVPELRDKWVHGSSYGWLATTDVDLRVTLVNPLTRAQIQLPEPTDLMESIGTYPRFTASSQHIPLNIKEHMTKVVLSENPSFSTGCVVATLMTTFTRLYVCRVGDDSWTRLVLKPHRNHYDYCENLDDVIFFQGKIYATTCDGQRIVIVDYDKQNFYARHVNGPEIDDSELNILSCHLVECSGDLLMILKRGHLLTDDGPPQTVLFELFRFEKAETWSRIYGIGDKCMYLGQNASISVTASEIAGCKPNCIYYLDHFHEGRDENDEFGYETDNGVFSLEENRLNVINFPTSKICWTWPAMWYQQNI